MKNKPYTTEFRYKGHVIETKFLCHREANRRARELEKLHNLEFVDFNVLEET